MKILSVWVPIAFLVLLASCKSGENADPCSSFGRALCDKTTECGDSGDSTDCVDSVAGGCREQDLSQIVDLRQCTSDIEAVECLGFSLPPSCLPGESAGNTGGFSKPIAPSASGGASGAGGSPDAGAGGAGPASGGADAGLGVSSGDGGTGVMAPPPTESPGPWPFSGSFSSSGWCGFGAVERGGTCDTCLSESCCSEIGTCKSMASCLSLATCNGSCGVDETGCKLGCSMSTFMGQGYSEWSDVFACVRSQCEQECGWAM